MFSKKVEFVQAKPVWLCGMQKEMNCTVIFKAFVEYFSGTAKLRVTGYTNYKVYVNNNFVGFGPARAGHGYYRVDELYINEFIKQGTNVIAIEVCGYNVNSYAYPNQPSFLQAEVLIDNIAKAYTDEVGSTFKAKKSVYKYKKVQRYSFQRPFVEAYMLNSTYNDYFVSYDPYNSEPLEICEDKNTISRNIIYYNYPISNAEQFKAGTFLVTQHNAKYKIDMWGVLPDAQLFEGFQEDNLEVNPYKLAELSKTISLETKNDKFSLAKNEFSIYRFESELTGFIGFKLTVHTDAIITITFDEILLNEDVSYKRMNCCNVLYFELKKGEYNFESAEPFSMKYCKLMVYSGKITVQNLYIRQNTNTDTTRANFEC